VTGQERERGRRRERERERKKENSIFRVCKTCKKAIKEKSSGIKQISVSIGI